MEKNTKNFVVSDIFFYWQHRVIVEYIGISKEGKNMFKTTNGGIIPLSQDKIQSH